MEVREIPIHTTKIVYVANDGKEFSDKNQCLKHEWDLEATTVYVVTRRGSRADSPELYSTLELAQEAIKNSSDFNINEVYLDERFWRRDK